MRRIVSAEGLRDAADNEGRIVWYHEVPRGLEATDFRTQTYKGKPVLTWWEGAISKAGVGRGEYVVYDDEYKELKRLKAGDGLDGDLHEFQLTPRGTAYLTAYRDVPRDLTSVGGPRNGYVYDSVVQEVDLDSDDVVFEWHSLDHVPLTESLQAQHDALRELERGVCDRDVGGDGRRLGRVAAGLERARDRDPARRLPRQGDGARARCEWPNARRLRRRQRLISRLP